MLFLVNKIKPRILKLTFGRGQTNLSIVSIPVSCNERKRLYYHAISVRQLSFDCCMQDIFCSHGMALDSRSAVLHEVV